MKPNKPFTSISDMIVYDSRLKPIDRNVYHVICAHIFGAKVEGHPSQERIAFLCGVSRRCVFDSIEKLIRFGYLTKERAGKQLSNHYVLNIFSTSDTQKQQAETEKQWKLRSAKIKSDENSTSHHSNKSDENFSQSDVNFLKSDENFSAQSDEKPTSQEAIQLEACQKLEASQNFKADASAPLRYADPSKNDGSVLDKNPESIINPKDTNSSTHSEPSVAPIKDTAQNLDVSPEVSPAVPTETATRDEKKPSLKSQFDALFNETPQKAVEHAKATAQSIGIEMQTYSSAPATIVSKLDKPKPSSEMTLEEFRFMHVCDTLEKQGVPETVLKAVEEFGIEDFYSLNPQYAILLNKCYADARELYNKARADKFCEEFQR